MTGLEAKEVREAFELSVQEFARALAINRATIHRWENDSTWPHGICLSVLEGLRAVIDEIRRKAVARDPKVGPEEAREELVRLGHVLKLGIGAILFTGLTRAGRE